VPCGRQLQPITCERFPIRRFHGDLTPTTAVTGRVEAMALWPGESVGGVTSVAPAATIVQELMSDAEHLLGRRGITRVRERRESKGSETIGGPVIALQLTKFSCGVHERKCTAANDSKGAVKAGDPVAQRQFVPRNPARLKQCPTLGSAGIQLFKPT